MTLLLFPGISYVSYCNTRQSNELSRSYLIIAHSSTVLLLVAREPSPPCLQASPRQ